MKEQADPVAEAFEERLEAITRQIDRLTRLAAETEDATERQEYWNLARDAQAEARKLRREFSTYAPNDPRPRPRLIAGWIKKLISLWRHA
jgi:hypothetical protein